MAGHYTDEADHVRWIPELAVTRALHDGETRVKRRLLTVEPVDVVMLRWPAEQSRRDELRRSGRPRLLLVEDGAPPVPIDECEDWIRVPAADVDLRARLEGLRLRGLPGVSTVPELDADGVLRVDGQWVSLPPVEARLTAALLGRYGAVVSRDSLARAGWPDGSPGRNALDVHVLRLRRRLGTVALAIRTVRSRGYLLERVAGSPGSIPHLDPGASCPRG